MAAVEDVTADFVYLRLHGDEELYASGYATPRSTRGPRASRLAAAAGEPTPALRISPAPRDTRRARDVFCYFDNTDKVQAPDNAIHLAQKVRARDERAS